MNPVTDPGLLGFASQAVCEMCHEHRALFRYELFSIRGSITGSCCLTCFPNLFRAAGDGETVKKIRR